MSLPFSRLSANDLLIAVFRVLGSFSTVQARDVSKLYSRAMSRIRQVSDRLYLREISTSEWLNADAVFSANGNPLALPSEQPANVTTTAHLPRFAKYLVIAAFLASYNPQKYDRRLFLKNDASVARKKGGGRKGGHIKETFGKERQQLLGPKVFPVERMVAIFHSILDEPVEVTSDLHTEVSFQTLAFVVCFGPAESER